MKAKKVRDGQGNLLVKEGDILMVRNFKEMAEGKPSRKAVVTEMDGNVAHVRFTDGTKRCVEL